jgi:hypothetical protein
LTFRRCEFILLAVNRVSWLRYFGTAIPNRHTQGLGKINFSEHDILTPFPEEHLGKYDVVRLRLLVKALRGVDVERAVRNLAALICK